jgi:hypothetical protein
MPWDPVPSARDTKKSSDSGDKKKHRIVVFKNRKISDHETDDGKKNSDKNKQDGLSDKNKRERDILDHLTELVRYVFS